MEIDQIQVVEYSVAEGCYHIHSLKEMLQKNITTIAQGLSKDYLPIGIFKSYVEAKNFIEYHSGKLNPFKKVTHEN
jgi:hypothetical protein